MRADRRLRAPLTVGRALALLLAAVGGYAALESWRAIPLGTPADPGPGLLPLVFAVALLLLAGAAALGREPEAAGAIHRRRALAVAALLVAYPLALPLLGFGITTAASLFLLARAIARAPLWRLAAFALMTTGAADALFRRLLAVPLPSGPWGF